MRGDEDAYFVERLKAACNRKTRNFRTERADFRLKEPTHQEHYEDASSLSVQAASSKTDLGDEDVLVRGSEQ